MYVVNRKMIVSEMECSEQVSVCVYEFVCIFEAWFLCVTLAVLELCAQAILELTEIFLPLPS